MVRLNSAVIHLNNYTIDDGNKLMKKMLTFLIDIKYQILISILLTITLYVIRLKWLTYMGNIFDLDKILYLQFIGLISSILALFCSIAFGFLIFIVQSLDNEKNENFRLFSDLIDKSENRLREANGELRCSYEFRLFIEEVRELQIEDMPLSSKKLKSLTEKIEKYDTDDDDKPQAPPELLNTFYLLIYRILKFEDISIKHSVSVLYSRTVKKSFSLLITTLLLLVLAINFYNLIDKEYFFYFIQFILFLLILFFYEIGWIINNYTRNFRRSLRTRV